MMKKLIPLFMLIFGIFVNTEKSFAENNINLSGSWLHDGRLVNIQKQVGPSFMFCNEQNDCADGFVDFTNNIDVPQWQVTGTIKNRGTVIYWSNNTVWTRNNFYPPYGPPGPPPFDPFFINGQWTHNGMTVFITVYSNGRLIITNEQQKSFEGYIDSNQRIIIPELSLQGFIKHNGKKIRWSNNTVWKR